MSLVFEHWWTSPSNVSLQLNLHHWACLGFDRGRWKTQIPKWRVLIVMCGEVNLTLVSTHLSSVDPTCEVVWQMMVRSRDN